MNARFAVRSYVRENFAVQKLPDSIDVHTGRPIDAPIYELEDTGERLTPIGSTVFWCDATSEVYRRIRQEEDAP